MTGHYHVKLGGHRGLGCTDHEFYQDKRDIASLPVENTLDSIKAAFEQGADYIETDAVMSKDGIIFALHNVVPKDHFFADDIPADMLNNMNFSDIAAFKTGHGQNGILAPLKDVLNHIAAIDPKTLPWAINIEIKGVQGSGQNYEQNDYLRNLAQTVRQSDLSPERILWSSFCLENIIRISHAFPESKYGMLFAEKSEPRGIYADHQDDFRYQYLPFHTDYIDMVHHAWLASAHADAALEYVHPEIMTVSPTTIEHAAQYNMGINAWALFEKADDARLAIYQDIAEQTRKNDVPLTVITDYIGEMQKLFPHKKA